ncbi:hypothetical protein K3495_g16069, partial [Podosphaera aphanis]
MPSYSKEDRVLLALQAMKTSKKDGRKTLSAREASRIFSVPKSTLCDRLNKKPHRDNLRPKDHKLDPIEEKVVLDSIIDQDTRGFSVRLSTLEDSANLLLASRNGEPVGKHWARRFVKSQPSLKTKINRPYDYQRALCEDPEIIENWFRLLNNLMSKYEITDNDLYNFDETGFMIGMITPSMVVTRADRRGRAKSIQPGNREWATAIECISASGRCLPPFIIVQGKYHLENWTTESGFPRDWVIKPTANGWTDNETGLQWLKHFDKHTRQHEQATYRMIILDGHESHVSAMFDEYCRDNKIIT